MTEQPLRLLPSLALKVGSPLSETRAGTWAQGDPPITLGLGEPQESDDLGQLGRLAFHGQNALGGTVLTNSDGSVRYGQPNRLLDASQLHLIYQRTPDVRAGFDQITRVVATSDWHIDVTGIDPDEGDYEQALEIAESVRAFLLNPSRNDWTWQEVVTAWVTDLLKYDSGPVELCAASDGTLEEIVPVNGGEVIEVLDDHGNLIEYAQVPSGGNISATPANVVRFPPDRMMLLQLFRSTEGPGGTPLLESLIYEVIAVLRGAEYIAQSLDMNEIPPGLLVVTGLANDALERVRDQFKVDRNRDWKIRLIGSQRTIGPVDAKWVEFRKAPRDLQIRELMKEIQRTIWRVIGVMPVTMGATDGLPRATAQVQLDASASHLIKPILELLAAKINSRVMPMLVPEEFAGAIEFVFRDERELDETEKKDRASRLSTLVDGGIVTVNEARAELGMDPVEGGDSLVPGTTDDSTVGDGDDDGDDADGDGDDVPDPPGEEEKSRPSPRLARSRARRKAARAARELGPAGALRISRQSATLRQRVEEFAETLPIEWEDGSVFEDYRTLDLPAIGEQILAYNRTVEPLWEEARTEVISMLSSHYKVEGFGEETRHQALGKIADRMEKLLVDWSVAVSPVYRNTALSAQQTAAGWVSEARGEDRAVEVSSSYRDRAIGYLVAAESPVSKTQAMLSEMLVQISSARSTDHRIALRGTALQSGASVQDVLIRTAKIFDGQKHRIKNWSGKLVELAYQVLEDQLVGGPAEEDQSRREPSRPVVWHAEWVSTHNKQACSVCKRESELPIRALGTLPTVPGGTTQCGGRCRCVLVYWTQEEVTSGKAIRMADVTG